MQTSRTFLLNRVRRHQNTNGKIARLTAVNPTTGTQVTQWIYGTTTPASEVASNELLYAKIYPDSSGGSDQIVYAYNRLGQVIEQTDQNGTVRQFDYDGLGRLTDDMAKIRERRERKEQSKKNSKRSSTS